jgi:hypothetical protein
MDANERRGDTMNQPRLVTLTLTVEVLDDQSDAQVAARMNDALETADAAHPDESFHGLGGWRMSSAPTPVMLTDEQRDLLQSILGNLLDQAHDATDIDYLAEYFETDEATVLAVVEAIGPISSEAV